MSILQMIIAYSVAWFLVLFMVLPFGLKTPETPGKGHVPSAPAQFNFNRKAIITSILAIIPVLAFKYLYEAGVVGL